MRPRRVPYTTLGDLLRRESAPEDPKTKKLMDDLKHVRRRGELSRAEFLDICRWKSRRALPHCRRNSAAAIRRVSRAALGSRDERQRIERLTSLHGVGLPMASAILTVVEPRRYGVIDVRVWQLLWALGAVKKRRFSNFEDWDQYLSMLRAHARKLRVPVRRLEHTLFQKHRQVQAILDAILYAKSTPQHVAGFMRTPIS